MSCPQKPIQTEYLGDLQIDSLDLLPEFLIAERDVTDPNSGDVVRALVRVPTGRLFPNGNYDNVTTLNPNNEDIVIPENQVRAGTIVNLASVNQVQYADAEKPAHFLMIGTLAGMVLIQNCGVVNIPAGHQYIVGADYYVGENGEPTTDSSITGQHLFYALSKTQLAVEISH